MKVSLLKIARKKEVIKRVELREIAKMIRENPEKDKVFDLRLNYQFYKSQRLPDGQITLDDSKHEVQWTGGGRGERTEDVRRRSDHQEPGCEDG